MGGQVLVRGGALNAVFETGSTATTYSTGKVIGTPTEIVKAMQDAAMTGILESLTVLDQEGQAVALDIWFFKTLPTSQGADTANFALNATDLLNVLGRISVATGDYTKNVAGNVAEATKTALGLSLVSGKGNQSIWMVVVCRGAPTWGTAKSLKVRLGILKD